jgi:hypothetical protein
MHEHLLEDKHPIQRIIDALDQVGARFLLIWLLAALLALCAVALLI